MPPFAMFTFDASLTPSARRALSGVPSRARVSPDGRRAALTVFESGHSYADGGFSTRTTIHDAASGHILADLEQFAVTRNGEPFKAVDFNFCGVTFAADGNRFFATLQSAAVMYLVEGDVEARTARVVRTGVECPSLSPDGRRLAFKKRVRGSATVFWNVAVSRPRHHGRDGARHRDAQRGRPGGLARRQTCGVSLAEKRRRRHLGARHQRLGTTAHAR
jgi:hypothetical protein